MKANTCLLRETWRHPALQGDISHTPRKARMIVWVDWQSREWMLSLTPREHAGFLGLYPRWLWQCWCSTLCSFNDSPFLIYTYCSSLSKFICKYFCEMCHIEKKYQCCHLSSKMIVLISSCAIWILLWCYIIGQHLSLHNSKRQMTKRIFPNSTTMLIKWFINRNNISLYWSLLHTVTISTWSTSVHVGVSLIWKKNLST